MRDEPRSMQAQRHWIRSPCTAQMRVRIWYIGSATDTHMVHEWAEKLGNLRAGRDTFQKWASCVYPCHTASGQVECAAIAIFTCHAFEIHGVRVTGHVSWSSRDVSMVWWVQSSKSHHKVLNQNWRGRTDRFWVHSFISDSSSTNHWADTLLMTKTIEPCLPRWTLKAQCKSNSTIL